MLNKINVEVRIKPSVENNLDSTDTTVSVGTKTYNFHKIHLTTSQKQLFKSSVEPLLLKFTQGYNCSVLAYGQTGSGKTYTMGISDSDTSGMVPQALEYLFNLDLDLSCTFIEIYNEDVIDLLSSHKVPLSLREIKGEIHIAGALEMDLKSVDEGLDVLRRGCLERTTKSTKMNSQSSRSHAIFTIFLKKEIDGKFVSSKFSFVDLAGSERLKRTMCIGERARESISINSGLLALGNVISALYKKSRHVPFRDSKLTRILQSCLNSFVLMIACISSSQTDIPETHNTLKYANRAASIQTTVRLNVEVDNSKMATLLLKKEIAKLRNENQILKERIRKAEHANVEELVRENRQLKSQIDNMKYQDNLNDKSEDLAQEIMKHPFVQNLINDNQRLCDEIEALRIPNKGEVKFYNKREIKYERIEDENDVCVNTDENKSNSPKSTLENKRQLEYNKPLENNSTFNKPLDIKSKIPKNTLEINNTSNSSLEINNKHKVKEVKKIESSPIPSSDSNPERTVLVGLNTLEIFPQQACAKRQDDFENEKCKKIKGEERKPSDQQKISWNNFTKKVTFNLEEPVNKRLLFTPRKDRVELNTDIVRFIEGYTPQSMVIHKGHLVFSSLDNKVRVWKDRVEDLFLDSGVRHLESSDVIYYTTRTILKQFDSRSVCRPIHAYIGEISCIKSIDNKIYTGHEDGTLNILDLRNMKIENIKLHNGAIFSIEKVNDTIFTGSRDHSVKSISHGIVALSPPHCDSVVSLLSYKGDLVSLGRDSSIRRWHGSKLVRTISNSHCTSLKTGVSLEDTFVTGDKSGLLKFWDFHKSNLFTVGELNMNNPINCMCSTKDGVYVGTSRKNISYVIPKYII